MREPGVASHTAGREVGRQRMLAKLAADRTRVFAVHFPFPGVGHVAADGEGFVWRPGDR